MSVSQNVTVGIRLTVDGRNIQGTLTTTSNQLRDLRRAGDEVNQGNQQLNASGSALTRTFSKYKDEIIALAQSFGLLKIVDYAKDATLLAARYETLGIVMHTAGNNAGYTHAQMDAYAKSLEKSGISMVKARETITDMATAQIDLNRSLELGRAAQDLAVVSGMNSSETLKQLITNIQQADTEGLRFMGITLDQSEALTTFARSQNTAVDSLTKRQKSEAILQAVLKDSAKYAGIYEQAMGTAGKALSSLDRYFENIKVKLGTPFLEGFAKGVFGVTDGVKQLNIVLDDLEKNGVMEDMAKNIGAVVGAFVSGVSQIVGVVGEWVGALVNVATAAKDFLKEHESVMTAAKVAAVAFALYMASGFLASVGVGFLGAVAQAWAMVGGMGAAFTAALVAARAFAAQMVLAFAMGGLRTVVMTALRGVGTAILTAIGGIPALIAAGVIAVGVGIGYLLWNSFDDYFKRNWPKTVAAVQNAWKGLKNLIGMGDAPAPDAAPVAKPAGDNQKALADSKARDAKEARDKALLEASKSAELGVASAEAASARMRAVNSARDMDLKRALDQRVIMQADYLKKKQKMDADEIGSEIKKVQAEQASLAAAMQVTVGNPRDATADKAKSIQLSAQEFALQQQLNASKTDYANRIADAMVESYTKEHGSRADIIIQSQDMLKYSKQELENAGKTAEQIAMLNVQRMQTSAAQLDATLKARVASGEASEEEIDNTNRLINTLRDMSSVRAAAATNNFSAELIGQTKTVKDETVAIYDQMKSTFIGTEEERIRAAAAASLKIVNLRKSEQLIALDGQIAVAQGSGDLAGVKAAQDAKKALLDSYASYEIALAENTNARVSAASDGFKLLADTLNAALDPNRAVQFGDILAGAFGRAGDSLTMLLEKFGGLEKSQKTYDDARAKAAETYGKDSEKYQKAELELNKRQTKEKLGAYADMAGAAKGFFKENSTGYKIMEAAEKGFRAIQFAMQMKELYNHLFVTTTKGAATVAGQQVETGAVIAGEAERNAAKTPGVFMAFMSAMGPWGLAAAAVAIGAVMGAASGSFGGGMPKGAEGMDAESVQKKQNKGTVLGDADAVSQSMANSLELMEKNSELELDYQNAMLVSLRNIATALTGAAKGILQTTGVTGGSAFNTIEAENNKTFGASKKTEILDSGVKFNGTFGQIRSGQAMANQYETARTSSDGGMFRGGWTRDDTKTKALGQDAMRPFAAIFDNMGDLLVDAGSKLGRDAGALNTAINNMSIDFGVSLRGLSGQDLTDALNAGVSGAFDKVTRALFPSIEKFQKMGEGLGETLVRVAADVQAVDSVFASMGKSTQNMTYDAREVLVQASGGLEEFASKAKSFMENFYTEAERITMTKNKLNPVLAQFGLSTEGDGAREMFKNFVLGLDTSTEAGAKTYAMLMDLQGVFYDVTEAGVDARNDLLEDLYEMTLTEEQLRQRSRNAVAAENRALFDQVGARKTLLTAYEKEKNALKTLESNMGSARDSMFKFTDSLNMGSLGLLTPMQKAAESQKQYYEAIAKVKNDPKDSASYSAAQQAATAFLTAQQAINGSSDTQLGIVAQVKKDMESLASLADMQMSDAQMQLIALDESVGQLVSLNETAVSIRDAILAVQAADSAAGAASKYPVAAAPAAIVTAAASDLPKAITTFYEREDKVVEQLKSLQTQQSSETGALIEAQRIAAEEAARVAAAQATAARRSINWKLNLTEDVQ